MQNTSEWISALEWACDHKLRHMPKESQAITGEGADDVRTASRSGPRYWYPHHRATCV